MSKEVKSVSFNDNNEKDAKMLKHISRRKFATYVKKLIWADIEKREGVKELKKEKEIKNPPIERRAKGVSKQIQQTKPVLFK